MSAIILYVMLGLLSGSVLGTAIVALVHRRKQKEFEREIRSDVERVSEGNVLQNTRDDTHWRDHQK